MMNGWDILRRARIFWLCFLGLMCLAWATLFAIFLSHEWSYSRLPLKIDVIGLLSLYVLTAILLYLMAVRHCCPWDASRMFAILVVHIGISITFTLYRPSFPCRGYDSETTCKDFVFVIFIGCWVFSGITLCFAIALGVMAVIPRPVEPEAALESLPLAEAERDDLPSDPDRFKTGNPTDERRTPPSPITTAGLPELTYNNGGELPGGSSSPADHNASTVNNIYREPERITVERPRQGFQSRNSRHTGSNENTRGGTMSSTRNAPRGSTSIAGPVRPRPGQFSRKFLTYSPTAAKVRTNRTSTLPKLRHNALSPLVIPLRNSRSLMAMPRDRAPEYTPTAFSVVSRDDSVLTPPWDLQPTYPGRARTTTPEVYYSQSGTEDVHSVEVGPTPYALHPSVPTPRTARFQDLSAFWGPANDISSGNNESFATGGSKSSNAPIIHSVSQPRRTVQRSGVGTAHRASIHHVPEVPFLRRGSDGQVLDQTQWWGLVRSAATKP